MAGRSVAPHDIGYFLSIQEPDEGRNFFLGIRHDDIGRHFESDMGAKVMMIGDPDGGIGGGPLIADDLLQFGQKSVLFRGDYFASTSTKSRDMIFQRFHDYRGTHLIDKVTGIIAFSAEVAAIGNLQAFFGDGDRIFDQGRIEVHAAFGIKAHILFFQT
ncbi:MAG: hypothetical protein NTZ26_09210 [Candidatus Aminicenantes bacterium]|nr:hypothetical protein [Candidatus Aminicenantes bacterium]